jgi:hypothetical protein
MSLHVLACPCMSLHVLLHLSIDVLSTIHFIHSISIPHHHTTPLHSTPLHSTPLHPTPSHTTPFHSISFHPSIIPHPTHSIPHITLHTVSLRCIPVHPISSRRFVAPLLDYHFETYITTRSHLIRCFFVSLVCYLLKTFAGIAFLVLLFSFTSWPVSATHSTHSTQVYKCTATRASNNNLTAA